MEFGQGLPRRCYTNFVFPLTLRNPGSYFLMALAVLFSSLPRSFDRRRKRVSVFSTLVLFCETSCENDERDSEKRKRRFPVIVFMAVGD